MDYIGSKEKLNKWIFEKIIDKIASPQKCVFLDACAGSGSVSRYAAKTGFRVVANDLFAFSSTIVDGSIGLADDIAKEAKRHIINLNFLPGIDGFFLKNFSCNNDDFKNNGRLFFTQSNARKLDAFRDYIDQIENQQLKNYLLYCCLEAMSRVLNTAGVQAAFLKKLKSRAMGNIKLREEGNIHGCRPKTFNMNILKLLESNNFVEDILYIDPPYNHRQYGPNYHLYETFVRNDKPDLKGLAGLRSNWIEESKSDLCSKDRCQSLFAVILSKTRAKYVYISYSSDGLLKPSAFRTIAEVNGFVYRVYKKDQSRYKADSSPDREYNTNPLQEYLFELIKNR